MGHAERFGLPFPRAGFEGHFASLTSQTGISDSDAGVGRHSAAVGMAPRMQLYRPPRCRGAMIAGGRWLFSAFGFLVRD